MASPVNKEWRNWADLPREVTAAILSRLSSVDTLTSAQFVCKWWLEVSKEPSLWKIIDMHNADVSGIPYDKLFRKAVRRSRGQAVEIIIQHFAEDPLLKLITKRCRRIKSLRLIDCSSFDLSDEALIETVEKLPALEEFEYTLGLLMDTNQTVEAIGHKCPSLKSFKLNTDRFRSFDPICDHPDDEDEYFNGEAIVIGKSMPGLKSLQIINNSLTNKGLKAILEGCPELESLDIRKCLNVRLEGRVWEMCVKRVKSIRLPQDSIEDYPYRTIEERVYNTGLDSDYDSDDLSYEDYTDYRYNHYGYDGDFGDFDDFDDFTVPSNYW